MQSSRIVLASAYVLLAAASAHAAIGYNRFVYQAPAGTAPANRFRVNLPAPPGGGNAYSHLVLRRPTIGGTLKPAAVAAAGGMTGDISGPINNKVGNAAFTVARNNSLDVYTRTVVKDSWTLATQVQFFNAAGAAIAVDNTPVGGWSAKNVPTSDSGGEVEFSLDPSASAITLTASVYRGMSYSSIEAAFDAFLNIPIDTPDIPDDLLSNPLAHFSGAVFGDSVTNMFLNGGDAFAFKFASQFGSDEGVMVVGSMDVGGQVRNFAMAMAVPTPGASALLSLAGLCTLRRRR